MLLLLLIASSAWCAELCSSCHPVHYQERGSCSSCHRGNQATRRKEIAHHGLIAGRYAYFTLAPNHPRVVRGERLVERLACRRCHRIAGKGNLLAADLDRAARKSPDELVRYLRRPVPDMPDFRLDEAAVADLINLLYRSAATAPKAASPPFRVRFERRKAQGDVFSRRCGACHRMLTRKWGALGEGNIGPNLSGLLSPHYPQSLGPGRGFGAAPLKAWLANPRRLRPLARMRPVPLADHEWRQLLDIGK